jgi:hypothetical protein
MNHSTTATAKFDRRVPEVRHGTRPEMVTEEPMRYVVRGELDDATVRSAVHTGS